MKAALSTITFLLFVFTRSTVFSSDIRYFKYSLNDRNWLPAFKHEVDNLSENNGTGYEVHYNAEGNYTKVIRTIQWEQTDADSYVYDSKGKLSKKVDYNFTPSDQNGIEQDTTLYEWEGDIAIKKKNYDLDKKLTSYWEYSKDGYDDSWTKYTGRNFEKADIYTTTELVDNLILGYKWIVSNTKYYDRHYDAKTGLLSSSKAYINGSYNFMQEFIYNDEGIKTAQMAINAKGRKYSTSLYDAYGRRTESYYTYDSGTEARYVWSRSDSGVIDELFLYRNSELAYRIKYIRHNSGNLDVSKVYDKNGALVAEYPRFIEYLNRDATSKEGLAGTIYKQVHLW